MEKKPNQIHPEEWLKDLPTQAQDEAFKPEEMLVCPKCARLSAPNRLNCFYCGAELPITDAQSIKPNLRKLELWEKGFNVILLANSRMPGEEKILEIAKLLRSETEDLQKILSAGKSLPVARVESEREAEIIVERLKKSGVEAFVLSDEKLKAETPARRLRGLEFQDDKLILILFNSGEIVEIARNDLSLIVSGALIVRKIESVEKLSRKDENKILEAAEISSDEVLIDIYNKNDAIGYRIESKGFDFSCLEGEKQLLVRENMKRLSEKLRRFVPRAKFDDDYRNARVGLSGVWEVGQSKDSKGLQRKGFGKFNLESVTTVNNLSQFTKYSRLQWHLL
jgi:hypothetical protein